MIEKNYCGGLQLNGDNRQIFATCGTQRGAERECHPSIV
jgi:hypothetical protein